MGLLGGNGDNYETIKGGEKLPEKIDYRLINYANLSGEEQDITYYNPSILQNPKNLILMIKKFKQQIEILEHFLDEMGAEQMYEKKMKDFDPEEYKDAIVESGEFQGIDLDKLT